ncbi:MAG: TonB-dependent receptor, partial [Flavobacteriia bacterium]
MNTRLTKLNSKFILSLMVVFFTSISEISAQVSIKGKVTDKANKEAIAYAKIQINSLNIGTLSDENGNYELKNFPNGEYILQCEFPGYQKIERKIKIENQIQTQNFELESFDMRLIEPDLPRIIQNFDEVFVKATKAETGSPTTFTNINKEQIKAQNFGQDLPYLLESTPSTVVTSDAGGGVGYTGVRIRGVDPTRTNVTVNGIPLNDSESHGVYWVNMPDFASSVENIQVQRGVGTSTNGAAAFGASMNIQTDKINREAYAEIANSYGSFNTIKNSVKAGTGLLNNHYTFDMRLSRIASDGFIDRASSDLKSFFVSGTYLGAKSLLKANVFSGKEQTYQAWYGVPESKLNGNQDSLTAHFYNNYYPGGMYQSATDSANLFSSNNRTYNIYNYNNETDNYQQTHYQLLYNYNVNSRLKLNLAGHFTHGEGYYEQYRQNDDFADYGLDTLFQGTDTITTTDLIRRRWLNNDFFGTVFSLDYISKKGLNVIFGGAVNQYNGKHYGEIIWARNASNSEIRDRYYDNDAKKTDVNAYLKLNKRFKKLTVFADLQVRTIAYSYLGLEQNIDGLVEAQQDTNFLFFNPKAGLVYSFNTENQIYTSFSIANR